MDLSNLMAIFIKSVFAFERGSYKIVDWDMKFAIGTAAHISHKHMPQSYSILYLDILILMNNKIALT